MKNILSPSFQMKNSFRETKYHSKGHTSNLPNPSSHLTLPSHPLSLHLHLENRVVKWNSASSYYHHTLKPSASTTTFSVLLPLKMDGAHPYLSKVNFSTLALDPIHPFTFRRTPLDCGFSSRTLAFSNSSVWVLHMYNLPQNV